MKIYLASCYTHDDIDVSIMAGELMVEMRFKRGKDENIS